MPGSGTLGTYDDETFAPCRFVIRDDSAPLHATQCPVHGIWYRGPTCARCEDDKIVAQSAEIAARIAKMPVEDAPAGRYCLHCGGRLTGLATKYCSKQCKELTYKMTREVDPTPSGPVFCEGCGRRMAPGPSKRYCTSKCKNRNRSRKRLVDSLTPEQLEAKRTRDRERYRAMRAAGFSRAKVRNLGGDKRLGGQ